MSEFSFRHVAEENYYENDPRLKCTNYGVTCDCHYQKENPKHMEDAWKPMTGSIPFEVTLPAIEYKYDAFKSMAEEWGENLLALEDDGIDISQFSLDEKRIKELTFEDPAVLAEKVAAEKQLARDIANIEKSKLILKKIRDLHVGYATLVDHLKKRESKETDVLVLLGMIEDFLQKVYFINKDAFSEADDGVDISSFNLDPEKTKYLANYKTNNETFKDYSGLKKLKRLVDEIVGKPESMGELLNRAPDSALEELRLNSERIKKESSNDE